MSNQRPLAARIAALSPGQFAQIQRRLKSLNLSDIESIKPRSRDGGAIPLSFGQERMWFVDQFDSGNEAYNLLAQYRMPCPLDQAALQHALAEVVRRHEVLRTSFRVIDGNPVQVIEAQLSVPLQTIDLCGRTECQGIEECNRLIAEDARRPFDLTVAPLLRANLFLLPGKHNVLALIMHHIVSDGWSLNVLFRELAAAYEAAVRGQGTQLPNLPIQYADFTLWQRRWLQGDRLEKLLSYWKKKLAGAAPALPLTTDRPRPLRWSYRGATRMFIIPSSVTDELRSLSQRQGATLFMTLLAAFKVLLARYTGQPDIIVGSSIANRNRAEIENLIGFFVNMLVLRTEVESELNFCELLERVRETTLGAYAHQDLPFEMLVAELQPQRTMSHNPLAQVMIDYQISTGPLPDSVDEDSAWQLADVVQSAAKFDMSLFLNDNGREIRAAFEYNTDLFDDATVIRWIGHFQQILREVVRDPSRPVGELSLISPDELKEILVEWNSTEAHYPASSCFHHLFEAQAKDVPDTLALVAGSVCFNYAELNRRSNRLAHYLRGLGVEPEMRVGVSISRSPDMVVALLAVLKAGGVYVPLDSSYPVRLLDFIIEDAGIEILITDGSWNAGPWHHGGRLAELGVLEEKASNYSDENPSANVAAANLAYIIYTSGSTGHPKGVMIEHRSVCNTTTAMVDRFRIQPGTRSLQFYSFSFDGSLFECLMALRAGATLYFVPDEASKPGAELTRFLRDQAINTAIFPPSALAIMPHENLPDLTTIIVGGEVCTNEVVNRWAPGRAFFNAYGPSEGAIAVTAAQCKPGNGLINIGHPMANSRIYILDAKLQPVPIGVSGEICIGGPNVARGYVGHAEFNAERFVEFHFPGVPADRVYRTGDRGCYLPGGEIQFLGRMDAQVKIRGYRVELDGVNAIILTHPCVLDSTVITREDTPGDKRLVAYVVPREGVDLTSNELHTWLRQSLPEYTRPSAFVLMESLPRSSAGKVAREDLPIPDRGNIGHTECYVEPSSELEQSLATIWKEILGLDRVGANDNFFDLGGHSLLATQVVSRIREQFEVELPLHAFFQGATVAETASAVNGLRDAEKKQMQANHAIIPITYAMEQVGHLSDSEVDARLEQMLSLQGEQK